MHRGLEAAETADKIKRVGQAIGIIGTAALTVLMLHLFIEERTWGRWVQIPSYVVIVGMVLRLLESYLPEVLHFKSAVGFGQYAVIWTTTLVVLKEFLPKEQWQWLTEKHWLPFLLIQIWILLRILAGQKGEGVTGGGLFYSSERGGGKRFSLAGAVWTLVGLAIGAFFVVKLLQEIDYGLSNAPERMALRGYVPRESVAAALAAAQLALPEVHTVIAPPLGADGKTNWSAIVVCDRRFWTYFGVSDMMRDYVTRNADGVVTNFVGGAGAVTNAFCSTTNRAITVKWLQSGHEMTPDKVKELLN